MLEITFFGIALVATIAGIVVFRRYGRALKMIDIPNERSAHSSPTLRGGGVVIVAVCLVLYAAASLVGLGPINWSYIAGAIVVAAVSWIDDATGLLARVKFLAHSSAAIILMAGSGVITTMYLPGCGPVAFPAVISYVITFLWLTWMVTVFNFMDGIDGLAGAQAVIAGIGWAAMGLWLGDTALYIFAGVVAFSSLGFLLFNWHPARLFMGDVGSAFLGYTFAAMPQLASDADSDKRAWLFTAAVSFVLLFAFDMAFTFTRRLLRGEKAWRPHREHLYQRLVLAGWAHSSVSLLYGGFGSLLVLAFIGSLATGGTWTLLLLLTYSVIPLTVVFLALRKKV